MVVCLVADWVRTRAIFLYPMLNTELLPPSGANTPICSGKRGGLLQQQISYILESFLTPSRKRFARLHFGSRKKFKLYKILSGRQ